MNTQDFSNHASQFTRRQTLRHGLYGAGGLMLAPGIAASVFAAPDPADQKPALASAAKLPPRGKARSVIQIFLWGGMSHIDTWDPKPKAGREYMGELNELVGTKTDGLQLTNIFPELARQSDKFSMIHSMTHGNNGHETAAYLMQTGHKPGDRLAYPSVGAVFALFKWPQYKGLIPPYVVLTRAAGRFSEEGFLGPKYKPFATGGNPNSSRFEVEGVVARGISDQRQASRRKLLGELNTMEKLMAQQPAMKDSIDAREAAYELILGQGKEVFDLEKESKETRDRYGRHTFGQECLAARRMVEAGVPYVTINYPGGWDTHKNHFTTMKRQCPELDQGLAALLEDLKQRGLLDTTIVWCSGEFGRGPKVDWQPPWNGGRNHFGKVFSVLVAGGGFKGGHVVGKSDEHAEKVAERPVYPYDLLGSIYHLAGIDPAAKLPHPLGVDANVLPLPSEKVQSGGLLTEIM